MVAFELSVCFFFFLFLRGMYYYGLRIGDWVWSCRTTLQAGQTDCGQWSLCAYYQCDYNNLNVYIELTVPVMSGHTVRSLSETQVRPLPSWFAPSGLP